MSTRAAGDTPPACPYLSRECSTRFIVNSPFRCLSCCSASSSSLLLYFVPLKRRGPDSYVYSQYAECCQKLERASDSRASIHETKRAAERVDGFWRSVSWILFFLSRSAQWQWATGGLFSTSPAKKRPCVAYSFFGLLIGVEKRCFKTTQRDRLVSVCLLSI